MTQMQAALQGIITDEMRKVADQEHCSPEMIREGLAAGTIVIPKNIHHQFVPRGIGKGLTTKINANIGTSEMHCVLTEEIGKMEVSVRYGADSMMDLSTGGQLDEIRRILLEQCPVMFGTVPIYSVVSKLLQQGADIMDMTADDLFHEIENQAIAGVDFITVHCGITLRSLSFESSTSRVLGIVSRGGSLIKRWMKTHNAENPLYAQYDRLLDIAAAHDVTLSLGDGLRPGAQADATDRAQLAELLVLGELVERARERGVQVMVEGPGHVPLNEVEMNVQIQKKICKGAPFYVLGPLVTDIAPGYDHIVGAIGGAVAAAAGADFLCYLTPAEHLTLPDLDDVKQGIMASRIAAHCGDVMKGIPGAVDKDRAISQARYDLRWEEIYRHALDPELARHRKESSESANEEFCSMCGKLCAIRTDQNKPYCNSKE